MNHAQNFDSLANIGTTNNLTITGWYLDESGTSTRNNGQYAADNGGSNTGDTYSYGATGSTERAFGSLLSGTITPTIGASFTNNTGATITSLDIAYTGEEWRLGTASRTDELDFQYSTNATSLTTGTWTSVSALNFVTPDTVTTGAKNGNASPDRTAISATISGLNIPNGMTFWMRWNDYNATSSDDGLAIDDFSLTPQGGVSTNPSGVGAANPSSVIAGANTLLTVAVTPGNFPPSTGLAVTGDLTPIGGSATQQFYDDGTHGDVTANDNTFSFSATVGPSTGAKTLTCTITDAQSRSGSATINLTVVPLVHIHDVQVATHISPYNGQQVALTPAIVTAIKRANVGSYGFWIEEPQSAWDASDATSEGIFVFTSSSLPTVLVGDMVNVTGPVSEYRAGGAGSTNLTLTEISVPTSVQVTSSGNPLPPAIIIGSGGRVPPTTVIEDDATGDVETSGVFDPASNGIDFYESLEGMLVQVNDAVAVGPTRSFSGATPNNEIPVIGDNGANASLRTPRGGIVVRSLPDFNPERIILNDLIASGPTLPAVNVADYFPGATIGVIDYNFGNYKLQVKSPSPLVASSGGIQPESVAAAGIAQLSIATFNVNNLSPNDLQSKFDALASQIINNLKSPDIIAVEEVLDNDGTTNSAVVAANVTWGLLITAIQNAGGPTYDYRQIDPIDDAEGGIAGGNIRVGFLFRTDRGLSFIDRPGGTSTTATTVLNGSVYLSYSPGRIDPLNTAWSNPNGTRRSLAGEFMFNGHHLFVIANHFKSKSEDQPLYGHYQPPVLTTEDQRNRQAQLVHDFVNTILGYDANANVVVLGDLNDFQFSPPLTTIKGSILTNLMDTLPENARYTYDYDGNSQALDHILLSSHLLTFPYAYQVVHVNAEFAVQASDHDPQVLQLTLKADTTTTITADPPDPTVAGQSYVVHWTVTTNATGTPTGNVTVSDGAGGTCSAAVAAGSCTLTSTCAGAKTLTATYAGDANFNGSSDTEPHTVNKADTQTTLTFTPNSTNPGEAVTFLATVTAQAPGAGTPTGSVTFQSNGSFILGCNAVPLNAAGQATCVTSLRTMTAEYSGDACFHGSMDTLKPQPVGGYLVPVSQVELLAPWLGLAALLVVAAAAVVVIRRRVA